jgi:multiple sugar transport system substrate-binding protein
MNLRGITWDHPRAYRPLEAFAALPGTPKVRWDRQPLADFEARSITELASDYDLLVVDHPGLGAAVRSGALTRAEELFDAAQLRTWARESVGPTWASYTIAESQWALPIDAATQVSIVRPDLLSQTPHTWQEVADLAQQRRIALCLGGPHAFLTLLAMHASAAIATDNLLDRDVSATAIELLQQIWLIADQTASLGDPIAVHEAMALPADLAYCPLAYGYAGYARPVGQRAALRWANAPSFGSARPGAVLGGTGLAFSALSGADPHHLRDFAIAFLDATVQTELVPKSGGQPAHRAVWDSALVDAESGSYYSSTRESLEASLMRPRIDGWIPLQSQASALVRTAITHGTNPGQVIDRINASYLRLRDKAEVP